MVFLRIVGKNEFVIREIAKMLLKEHLVIDVNLKLEVERLEYEAEEVKSRKVFLMTAKTKGLLFPKIDELIRQEFINSLPEIYTLPIVHMDWEQAEKLGDDVRLV